MASDKILHSRRETRVACLLLIVTAIASASCSGVTSSASPGRHKRQPSSDVAGSPTPVKRTWLGPDGVESDLIINENRRPGTAAWQITNQGTGVIQGYADHNYARVGDSVGLYVSTDQQAFKVVAYRMGWYQGLGGREVWSSATIPGGIQPACTVAPATNMVSCDNWRRSLSFQVTSDFVPGDYLLKLVASNNRQAYIMLTVWNPASTAAYLVMNRSLVEEGWNTFGGYSFYEGQGPCLLDHETYPPCNRARVVSFDRPFDVNGSSDFLDNEYPMVQLMESDGLDVTYCTDVCISDHPSMLLQHRALIALDHDETWTNAERVGALSALAAGVNMAFFGAATLVRHARLEPSGLGLDRQEVDYRNSLEDPLDGHGSPMDVTGNTWGSPPSDWNASSFVGQIYSGYLEPGEPNAAMVPLVASSWIFAGTGLAAGQSIPSMINSDIDHIDPAGPIPADLEVLAHSPIPLSEVYTNQGAWGGMTYSDMTYYTDPSSHGGVFDSGDNVWVGALRPCSPVSACPSAVVRKMTENVLRLFGQGPAGKLAASVANWRAVTPPGS